jgi:UDP-N-acetylglucosamine 2-epimerase
MIHPLRILAVIDSRPDAIELVPVVQRLRGDSLRFQMSLCVAAAQHRAENGI